MSSVPSSLKNMSETFRASNDFGHHLDRAAQDGAAAPASRRKGSSERMRFRNPRWTKRQVHYKAASLPQLALHADRAAWSSTTLFTIARPRPDPPTRSAPPSSTR